MNVTHQAGLDVVQGPRRSGDACLFSPPSLTAHGFPVPNPKVIDEGDACSPERESGGAAVADYDGDGYLDLYVTRLDGPGTLYHNNGNGTFTDVTAPMGLDVLDEPSNGAGWADLDNDGYPDLVVTTIGSHRLWLFHNDGGTHFTEEALPRSVAETGAQVHDNFSVTFGDYDNDGYLDMYTTEWREPGVATSATAASYNRLLHNLGAAHPGYFEDVTNKAGVSLEPRTAPAGSPSTSWGFSAALTDLDGDGRPDLYVASDFKTARLFWNEGGGHFVDGSSVSGATTAENAMGLTIADYDGDGRPDIFVTSIWDPSFRCGPRVDCPYGTTGNRLYRNTGNRIFTDATSKAGVRAGGWGWGAAFFDPTNSGRQDLVMTSGVDFAWYEHAKIFLGGPTHYWVNNGNGTFAEATETAGLTVPGPGKGLLTFDFDNDGRPDLLILRDGQTPVLYRNVTPNPGAWLRVVAQGTTSNRDGIGVVVTARAGGHTQTATIGSVTYFLAQSDTAVHFGFGHLHGSIDTVTVHFPTTGRTVTLHHVKPDRTLTVVEPDR